MASIDFAGGLGSGEKEWKRKKKTGGRSCSRYVSDLVGYIRKKKQIL